MTLYFDIGDKKDAQSMQSTAALLYFIMALCGFGAAAVVPSLTMERALFIRERSDGCYSAMSYWVHKLLQEGVVLIFTSFIFCVPV
jgi:hypothetical protein